jgi:hypothetical protein
LSCWAARNSRRSNTPSISGAHSACTAPTMPAEAEPAGGPTYVTWHSAAAGQELWNGRRWHRAGHAGLAHHACCAQAVSHTRWPTAAVGSRLEADRSGCLKAAASGSAVPKVVAPYTASLTQGWGPSSRGRFSRRTAASLRPQQPQDPRGATTGPGQVCRVYGMSAGCVATIMAFHFAAASGLLHASYNSQRCWSALCVRRCASPNSRRVTSTSASNSGSAAA